MLYALLKPLVTAALRLYFRRINCNGLEHIDNGRPTLILANHTASFMDAILVACFVKRRIHFFARGDVFGNNLADKILRSIGLLPVYRLSEGRDKLHLNDSSNDEALQILAKGGAVLIFCEGVSDTAKRLKPMKKGPFRLAANAAASLPEAPVIVPLGINYVTPTQPCNDVFLEGGAEMKTVDFLIGNAEAALAKGATNMMRQTADELQKLVWHVDRMEDASRADDALVALQETNRRYKFDDTQRLLHGINAEGHTKANQDPICIEYDEDNDEWASEDHEVAEQQSFQYFRPTYKDKIGLGRSLLLLLPAPFVALAWIFHQPVVQLSKQITKRSKASDDFIAPIFLSCCLLLMIGWYLCWFILAEVLYPSWMWLLLFMLLSAFGVLYLKVYLPLIKSGASHAAINEVEAVTNK